MSTPRRMRTVRVRCIRCERVLGTAANPSFDNWAFDWARAATIVESTNDDLVINGKLLASGVKHAKIRCKCGREYSINHAALRPLLSASLDSGTDFILGVSYQK